MCRYAGLRRAGSGMKSASCAILKFRTAARPPLGTVWTSLPSRCERQGGLLIGPRDGSDQVLRQMRHSRHNKAIANQMLGVVVLFRQFVFFRQTHQAASSLADSSLDRTLSPSTTRMVCRLEPPLGVRRHPAISSNRTSARTTPPRVRLYSAPTRKRLACWTALTFSRLSADMLASSAFVFSSEFHATPKGSGSIKSANTSWRSGGNARFHQSHLSCSGLGSMNLASTKFLGCHKLLGSDLNASAGNCTSGPTASMNSLGRDCGTKWAASMTRHPTR